MTNAKLHSHNHLGLEKYSRKQNSGNMINVVIGIKEDMIPTFEELSGISLQNSHDFQGTMNLN